MAPHATAVIGWLKTGEPQIPTVHRLKTGSGPWASWLHCWLRYEILLSFTYMYLLLAGVLREGKTPDVQYHYVLMFITCTLIVWLVANCMFNLFDTRNKCMCANLQLHRLYLKTWLRCLQFHSIQLHMIILLSCLLKSITFKHVRKEHKTLLAGGTVCP